MLVDYRSDYEKIVMGQLSFIADLKPISRLQTELQWQLKSPQRPVYLWRDEFEHLIGTMCCELGAGYVLVRRLSFIPTNRTGRNIFAFLTAVQERYPERLLLGTLDTQPIINNWRRTTHG